MSDQESEPAAAEDVKLEEELKRFVSQATQTVGDVTDVADGEKDGGGERVKVEDESAQVQITASLSEVQKHAYY